MTASNSSSDTSVSPEHAPSRAGANRAFTMAMTGVRTRCGQLKVAISNHDLDNVQHFAQAGANLWLTGRSACRRLLQGMPSSSPYAEFARQLLEQEYMSLLEVLRQATGMFDVPRVRRTLLDLRETLRVAMARPLVESATAAPRCLPEVETRTRPRWRSFMLRCSAAVLAGAEAVQASARHAAVVLRRPLAIVRAPLLHRARLTCAQAEAMSIADQASHGRHPEPTS